MTSRRRLRWMAGATILAMAMAMAAALTLPGTAYAQQPCSFLGGAPAESSASCTTTGSVMLSGTLTMDAPPTLTWYGWATGATQTLYDTNPGDTVLDVTDTRGLPPFPWEFNSLGWNITAIATQFTGTNTGATIPDDRSGSVLAIGGGDSTATAANVPGSACATPNPCQPAATSLGGYPIFIPTTSQVPVRIYDAEPGTGTGIVQIGSYFDPFDNTDDGEPYPAVWSVTLPGDVTTDTYTSIITTTVAAGP